MASTIIMNKPISQVEAYAGQEQFKLVTYVSGQERTYYIIAPDQAAALGRLALHLGLPLEEVLAADGGVQVTPGVNSLAVYEGVFDFGKVMEVPPYYTLTNDTDRESSS